MPKNEIRKAEILRAHQEKYGRPLNVRSKWFSMYVAMAALTGKEARDFV